MSVRSYLRLMRIPNVFTAFANVVAGVCVAHRGAFEPRDVLLVLASGCLYCAGMVWNDYFDREVDAVERPDRPIPSGAVSARTAAALGCGLCALGLGLAALHGTWPLLMAAALTAAILAYDAWLKGSAVGPLAMGACRALNVLLGASVAFGSRDASVAFGSRDASVAFGAHAWLTPHWFVLGAFTLQITELSRFEVGGTQPERVQRTLHGFVGLGVVAAVFLTLLGRARDTTLLGWLVAACAFVYVIYRERQLLTPLWSEATGPSLGRAIGGGILLMPAIDASFVAAAGAPLAAAATAAFMAPAWLLKRWYYLT